MIVTFFVGHVFDVQRGVPSKVHKWRKSKNSETSKAFTRQMAYYETKIRQEILFL